MFYQGTVEWRLFNSTLHAGEAKANIILAMAISAQGINQKYTQFRKTPIGDNPAFTFRTFLLRLGLIGPEYKNVRSILYSKEDILFAALKVNPARIDSYCQAVDEPILEEIRKLPSGASMDQLKDRWYQGRDGSDYHYHSSRYRACYAQKKVMLRIF